MTHEIFAGSDGRYYWRARAANGRIVADGSQGYKTRKGAAFAARRVWSLNQSFFFTVAHV